MKRHLLRALAALSVNFFVVNHLAAQDSVKSLPPVIVKATTIKIPGKVWKGFSSYFNDAEMPMRWYRLNKNYLVKFMIYDEQNRALFSKKGRLIYHITYGYEKSLPQTITLRLRHSYPGYNITRVIKVIEAGREIWVINLENTSTLVLLRIEDDEIEEVQIMDKS